MIFTVQKLARVPAFLGGLKAKFNALCEIVDWLTRMQESEYISIRKTSTGWSPEINLPALLSAVGYNGQTVDPYREDEGIDTGSSSEGSSGTAEFPEGLAPRLLKFCDTDTATEMYMWVLGWEPSSTPPTEPTWPPV